MEKTQGRKCCKKGAKRCPTEGRGHRSPGLGMNLSGMKGGGMRYCGAVEQGKSGKRY